MVSPLTAVYLGQVGRLGPFGSPVFMNCSKAPAIFSDSALGPAPPPVWVSIRSVLENQKQISTQWNARMRLSNSGGCHVNQLTKTGAGCFDFTSASATTPARLAATSDQISTGFLPGKAFA